MLGKTRAAFTLIEVLVCISVLLPVLGLVVGFFPFTQLADDRARHINVATGLAVQQMEVLRDVPFDSQPPTWSTSMVDESGVVYTCDATLTPWGNDMKQVAVVVSWQARQPESVELDTVFAKFSH